ncbi:MAG TPA: hypothetical protein VFZ08_02275 [Terriglobia bacterium]|nr:hypothetical protein [Terriglobia bacterium]
MLFLPRLRTFATLPLLGSMLFAAGQWGHHKDNAADLSAHIQREKNPVKKAKLEIRLSKLDLEQAKAAYQHHRLDEGKKLLGKFLSVVNESWSTLKSSGRDAAKKPQGFMQLEIALREDARMLHDLRERLSYFDRGSVDQTIHQINQLHSEVLVALFPSASQPSRKPPKKSKVQADRMEGGNANP